MGDTNFGGFRNWDALRGRRKVLSQEGAQVIVSSVDEAAVGTVVIRRDSGFVEVNLSGTGNQAPDVIVTAIDVRGVLAGSLARQEDFVDELEESAASFA